MFFKLVTKAMFHFTLVLIYIGFLIIAFSPQKQKSIAFSQLFIMRTLAKQLVPIVLLLVLLIEIEGDLISLIPKDNANKYSTNTSVEVEAVSEDQESPNCGTQPWICDTEEPPPRRVCCRNRCVDVFSDADNCGLCGLACPMIGNWQCCWGVCVNINFSPLNCGACGRPCRAATPCLFGRCPFPTSAPPSFLPPPSLLPPGSPEENSPKIPNH